MKQDRLLLHDGNLAAQARLLHISDIHLAPWQHRRVRFLKSLADLAPDLVVNTGDNLGHRNAIPRLLEALKPLMVFPGVFVNGSNDYFGPRPVNPIRYLLRPSEPKHETALNTNQMTSVFESAGWVNLNNQSGELHLAGQQVQFVGLDDAHINRDIPSSLPKIEASQILVIGLSHAPYRRVIDAIGEAGADLLFCGHTHGGQIRIPWLYRHVIPSRYGFDRGEQFLATPRGRVRVYTTVGTGEVGLPVRVFNPPTIDVLDLRP